MEITCPHCHKKVDPSFEKETHDVKIGDDYSFDTVTVKDDLGKCPNCGMFINVSELSAIDKFKLQTEEMRNNTEFDQSEEEEEE